MSATTPMGTSSSGEGWPGDGGTKERGGGTGGFPPSGTGGRGYSRAARDDNWRSPTTPQEEKPPVNAWSNQWQQPHSPSEQYGG